MPFVNNDFQCNSCGCEFNDLWKKPMGDHWDAWKGEVECPSCKSQDLVKLVSATGAAEFSLMDQAGRAASLRKRSLDHSKKMMRKDMDKHRGRIQRKIEAIKNG